MRGWLVGDGAVARASSLTMPDPVFVTVLPLTMARSPSMALRLTDEVAETVSPSILRASIPLHGDVWP